MSLLSLQLLLLCISTNLFLIVLAESTGVEFPPGPTHPFIRTVSGANFRQDVVDPTLPVILEFYVKTDKHSKDFAPDYEKAAKALQGHAKFTALDAMSEEGQGLAQMFGVQTAPAVLLFNPELLPVQGGQEGQYLKMPIQFPDTTGKRDAATLVRWILANSAGDQIDRIDDTQDLEDFLERYKLLDMPKIILFLPRDPNVTTPVIYKTASHEWRYTAWFGLVRENCTEVVEKYGITQFPSVISIDPNGEVEELKDGDGVEEKINLEKLNQFIGKVALSPEKKMQLQGILIEEEVKRRKKEAEEAKMNRALPPIIPTSKAEFEDICMGRKKGFCVACFVEDLSVVDMEMLERASRKMAQRSQIPSQIVVLDGQKQFDMAEYFQATQNGFPDVVYILPSKKRYSKIIGTFTEQSLVSYFANKAATTKGMKYERKKVPDFVEEKKSGAQSKDNDDDDVGAISDEM